MMIRLTRGEGSLRLRCRGIGKSFPSPREADECRKVMRSDALIELGRSLNPPSYSLLGCMDTHIFLAILIGTLAVV